MPQKNDKGSAIIIVLICFVILLTLFTVALRSVYEQHKNNRKVLKQLQRSAERLESIPAEQKKQ